MRKVFIYAITHNRSGAPIYIGQTANVKARFANHISSKTSCVRRWIDDNSLSNDDVSVVVLQEVLRSESNFVEAMHIKALALVGVSLINVAHTIYQDRYFNRSVRLRKLNEKLIGIENGFRMNMVKRTLDCVIHKYDFTIASKKEKSANMIKEVNEFFTNYH